MHVFVDVMRTHNKTSQRIFINNIKYHHQHQTIMVAGQVDATDAVMHNVRGFPSEKKLAEKVLALPDQVRGKTLIPATIGGDIAPCHEAGKVVKVSITHGRFKLGKLLSSMKDNYSLVDATTGEAFAGGAHIVESNPKAILAGGTRLVLKDQHETPVSICFTRYDAIRHNM
jgi:hypothetical protein